MTDTSEHRGRLRRVWLALAVATALLAGYVSLVPFDLHRPSPGWLEAFWHSLDDGIPSRGNFLANILLFVPVGLAGLAAFGVPPRRPVALVTAAIATIVIASAWSFTIELSQAFAGGRSPSLADVVAQVLGTIAGIFVWLICADELSRLAGRLLSGDRFGLLPGVLGVYTIGRVLVLLLPLDVTVDFGYLWHHLRDGGVVFNPLKSSAFRVENIPSSLLLIVLALPVGFFAVIGGVRKGSQRSLGSAFAFAAMIFAFAEAAQFFIVSTRADAGQMLVNIAGAWIGVLIARRAMPQSADATPEAGFRLAPALSLLAACACFLIYNWMPFDFDFSRHVAAERFNLLLRPPLAGYYENPEFKALADIAIKLAVSVPMGLAFRWLLSGWSSYRRVLIGGGTAMAVAFVSAVEVGQVLLPSRYPESTDILLGVLGIAIGWWLPRYFARAN